MRALIFGDSQTLHTGKELEARLRALGHQVSRVSMSGKSTADLLARARKELPRRWDEVYLSTGGNDVPDMPGELAQLIFHFGPSGRIFLLPLPPATLAPSKPNPAYLFPKTAASRERKARLYTRVAKELGVEVIDYRHAPLSKKVRQPSGLLYPTQRDGFHTRGESAREMAAYVMERRAASSGGAWWVAAAIGAALAIGVGLALSA